MRALKKVNAEVERIVGKGYFHLRKAKNLLDFLINEYRMNIKDCAVPEEIKDIIARSSTQAHAEPLFTYQIPDGYIVLFREWDKRRRKPARRYIAFLFAKYLRIEILSPQRLILIAFLADFLSLHPAINKIPEIRVFTVENNSLQNIFLRIANLPELKNEYYPILKEGKIAMPPRKWIKIKRLWHRKANYYAL